MITYGTEGDEILDIAVLYCTPLTVNDIRDGTVHEHGPYYYDY